jgi:hypothetical protein
MPRRLGEFDAKIQVGPGLCNGVEAAHGRINNPVVNVHKTVEADGNVTRGLCHAAECTVFNIDALHDHTIQCRFVHDVIGAHQ